MRRTFNRGQRVDLYLLSKGLCAHCGETLRAGWHADHVLPWSHGGLTDIRNGQALCPSCNLTKGSKMSPQFQDSFTHRPWAKEAMLALTDKIEAGEKSLVMDVFCGSGKTAAFMAMANHLYRIGVIKRALILTPRWNLCQQYQKSWNTRLRPQFASPKIGLIHARTNDPPWLKTDMMYDSDPQHMVALTYQSLVSRPALAERWIREEPTLVCCDEAQILGGDPRKDGPSTRAAEYVLRLQEVARFLIAATGTSTRSDGGKLVIGNYSPTPNAQGYHELLADVRATYRDGIRHAYLVPFVVYMFDGTRKIRYLDETTETVENISEIESGLARVLREPDVWREIVDEAVLKLEGRRKREDARYSMLIGAVDQRHAREIFRYVIRKYPHLKPLLAISDDPDGHDNLARFAAGGHGILVSVQMAYVGYDAPWIKVVALLGAFRFHGWLDQFIMRGGRVQYDCNVPPSEQHVDVFCTNDRLARKYFELRRSEECGEIGFRPKLKIDATDGPPAPREFETLQCSIDGMTELTIDPEREALALDPSLKALREQLGLHGFSFAELKEIVGRLYDPKPNPNAPPPFPMPEPNETEEDSERRLRRILKDSCTQVDAIARGKVPSLDFGWAHTRIIEKYKVRSSEASIGQLKEMIRYAKQVLLTEVQSWKVSQAV